MRKLFFLLIAFFITNSIYAAEKATFTASAPDVVVVGDQFRISYRVTTDNVKNFRAPSSFTGFDVLAGPSPSRQKTVVIDGGTSSSSSITYTYILRANKEGKFSIPAATIVANGDQLISNAVNIKVLPKDKNNNSGSNISSSSGSNISNQDLFVTSNVTKTTVYEQEAFLLTYKIYRAVDLRNFNNVKIPDFKGFLSQEVETNRNVHFELEHYNGRNYYAGIYRQFILFPQQAGELTIESARFDAIIAKPVALSDPFDAYFNGGNTAIEIKKTLHAPAVKIKANPLPAGKPSGFSGGVGEFNITSSISSQEIKTNDAITIKVAISGVGNLKLVANPKIEFPANFETYEPKVNNKVMLTRDGNAGSKEIEYLAIAREPGVYKIPGVTFSYFDIKSKSYKTLKLEDYEIKVEKGEGSGEQVVANFTNKEDIKVLGSDIRFIKRNNVKLHSKGDYFYGSLTYWLWYIIPLLTFVLFFIIYRKQAVENANIAKVRTKKANKIAVKRLKVAGKLLANNQKDDFYDEVLKALWGYIGDKLNMPVSKLSKDNIEEKLEKRGVNDELIREFIDALHECEFARFAPGDESQAMDNVYSVALNVISKIENSIKQ